MFTGGIINSGPILQEADFYIHELYPISFFGTTVAVLMIFTLVARHSVNRAVREGRQNTLSTIVEMGVDALTGFVEGVMGKAAAKRYITYIGVLFLYIFISNTSGVLGLRPPTADYGTTLCLALITFVMIQYANIRYNKIGAFTSLFEPIFLFFPMNVISEFSTPISMSLRLFGNIVAGTVLMALYYGMLPWFAKLGIPAFLHVYFDLFSGAIQTYVFCMLTITFVKDKRGAY
jgi:F-type H+-transporting ATPase subunit a